MLATPGANVRWKSSIADALA
eukprot:SAG22_NODE_11925_length_463_cov_0.920330_1_plen_20_part_10